MNNYHTITISEEISRTAAIKLIKSAIADQSAVVMVDLLDASFPLHRDFFLVLSKKFPKDRFILRVKTEKIAELARSLGIQAEIAWLQAEFERMHTGENLAKQNMSMFEYFLYEIRRGWLWLKFVIFERKNPDAKLPQYKKNNMQMFLIIVGLITSLVLLLFIFNFAISKSIVTISPQVSVRPVSANILYRLEGMTGSVLEQKNVLRLRKMEIPVEITSKFTVTSIDPASSKNAIGIITIYNELTTEQELRPQTRFVTNDGLVYRSEGWVKVPATRALNGVTEIGMTELQVVADINDESGKLMGDRGNIAQWTNLIIPGLKFNRDKVYAKAKENFLGGENPSVHVLTEEELKTFKDNLNEKIKKEWEGKITQALNEQKAKNGEEFALMIPDTVKMSDTAFELISGQNIGDKVDEVEIKAKATVYATVMDRKATIEHLTNIFHDNLLRGTNKELGIHPDTLRVSNIVSRSEDGNEIKATLEMNTSTVYDFENATNELTKRLKTIIAGNSKKEAIDRLINEWQIKEAHIQNTPFWVQNVSNNPDNIEFVIKK